MLTTEADLQKRWLRAQSFLLFLVYMLAGALGAVIPEIFGQMFDNIRVGFPSLVEDVLSAPKISFFMGLSVWVWLTLSIVGLLLAWGLIRLSMASSGGKPPVKMTMFVALIPIGVLAFQLFAFIAPTQEIIAGTGVHEHGDAVSEEQAADRDALDENDGDAAKTPEL